MAFCTQCGHRNTDTHQFCEECGNALKRQPGATAASNAAAVPTGRNPGRKPLFIAVGLLLFLLLCGGLYYLLAPEEASEKNLAAAVERFLVAHPDAYQHRYCVNSLPYDQEVIEIGTGAYERRAQQWMEVLVEAGLYNKPERIKGKGWFAVDRLRYARTESGEKAIRGQSLCVADGLTVSGVEDITPPLWMENQKVLSANIRFGYQNLMPWTQSEKSRALLPDLGAEFNEPLILVLKERQWEVASPEEARQARRAIREARQTLSSNTGKSGGVLESLSDLFNFSPDNPALGNWKASSFLSFNDLWFEFHPDTMVMGDQTFPVTYQIEKNQVTVLFTDKPGQKMTLQVINDKQMSGKMDNQEFELERAE